MIAGVLNVRTDEGLERGTEKLGIEVDVVLVILETNVVYRSLLKIWPTDEVDCQS